MEGQDMRDVCLSNHTTTHKRAYGGINGLTPSEMFLQTFNKSYNSNEAKQKSVTYVGNSSVTYLCKYNK